MFFCFGCCCCCSLLRFLRLQCFSCECATAKKEVHFPCIINHNRRCLAIPRIACRTPRLPLLNVPRASLTVACFLFSLVHSFARSREIICKCLLPFLWLILVYVFQVRTEITFTADNCKFARGFCGAKSGWRLIYIFSLHSAQ